MASNLDVCHLLRSLARSKISSDFLELGTGTGLATSFILDGMDEKSTLVSIDNDANCLDIAKRNLAQNARLTLIETDGGVWLANNKNAKFDFIFADTWHGKYLMLEEVLKMVNIGGFYIIDDMLPQSNWPEGHDKKVDELKKVLRNKDDFSIVEMNWASGIIIATRTN
ncbi:MAG: SAM-dependent methyltransferase [Pseudopedobacter saltans]|uniref:SAM-dependent methyltransferase n=1 Tax=Pseudopedobacter saltans TaxID=151895 RepID=A0A2W5ERR8_9SPHI|nr:MAG: SAM-dependent methyltransferase [Pseudopedobacter saltans]